MEKIPGKPNFHRISKERAELRRALQEAGLTPSDVHSPEKGPEPAPELQGLKGARGIVGRRLAGAYTRSDEAAKEFKAAVSASEGAYKLSDAKKFLAGQRESDKRMRAGGIDEAQTTAEMGLVYQEAAETLSEQERISIEILKNARDAHSNGGAAKEPLIRASREALSEIGAHGRELSTEHPSEYHAAELVRYARNLREEGHIARVPSVEHNLQEIGSRMVSGKPMFLHGPTGTGKTSLARLSAKALSGIEAEMIYCNPQTRESSVWGKTGIRPAEGGSIQTVDIFGPLARAMDEGKASIFDEFTALPKEQMSFVKGIFNAKPGDMVNVVGNGRVRIKPGFQMIFTANLKSDKNPERQDLPPEIAREFEQNNLEVGYTPPDESYDIMLARLMQPDGSVHLSRHDLTSTLPKLCEAIADVQRAYTGELDATMKNQIRETGSTGLKKLVFTQGTVENILDAWQLERKVGTASRSFVEFLDGRLETALTFKEYPASDRKIAAKILALKGFLATSSPARLSLSADTFAFSALHRDAKATAELVRLSSLEEDISLSAIAELDPFGRRARAVADEAREFAPQGAEATPHAVHSLDPEELVEENKPFLSQTFKGWYDAAASKVEQKAQVLSPLQVDYAALAQEQDAKKFGEYIVNPEAHNADFEHAKVEILDLSNMVGKPRHEVAAYLAQTYGAERIAGIEYWKWVAENPTKAPQELKDGNYHYFFGSPLCDRDGCWSVPCVLWKGSAFERGASWLGSGWGSRGRVVLLEI